MGPMMMQTAETQTVMDNPANDEPHVVSSYRDNQHFEETIQEAAGRIMRWSGLRFQWYVLTIGGVVLIVFTLLKLFEILIGHEPQAFLSGVGLIVAWIVALGWTWLYNLQANGFSKRIIRCRLCLVCGKSLIEEPTDEQGAGVCSHCCHVFNLGEYVPPQGSIEALRATRDRMDAALRSHAAPPITAIRPSPALRTVITPSPRPGLSLYKDEHQFNRVMSRAAARHVVFKPYDMSLRFAFYGLLLPLLVFTLLAFSILPLDWPATSLIAIVLLFMLFLLWLKRLAEVSAMQCRIVKHRLCLVCCCPLNDITLDEQVVGFCPECGHPFHALVYEPPGMGERNPTWRDLRRDLFTAYEGDSFYKDAVPPYLAEKEVIEDPPGSGRHIRLFNCISCGYILEGTPTDEDGRGICSECGRPFRRPS